MSYTFGDTDEASMRLRRLAEVYEPETRALFEMARSLRTSEEVRFAVDLGSGPGWSTALLDSVVRPVRTVGLEASERYVAEARANHLHLEFFSTMCWSVLFRLKGPTWWFAVFC
jgi:trans-aconitate 2-methyltransferase